jgi:acyl-coenzyme A synthetase/AMP-(fatty) acid ligase/acyl carrier protein
VIVGGDVIPAESLKVWQQSPLKQVRLLNAYGPTETTITATTYEIPAQSDGHHHSGSISNRPQVTRKLATGRIPIGRPLANRKVYILDRHGNPVPIGVPGELYLGGAGLARGYLKRPELTEEKFIRLRLEHSSRSTSDRPESTAQASDRSEAGVRVYKTGDLARYLPDGNIEFLGRIDHQVKVRGFRIELGEIESTLREHAAISDAVVVAHSRWPGDKHLVAFYVPASEITLTASELRHYLKTKLPDFMVPSTFVALRALPTTASGKPDRRALAAMETVPGSAAIGQRSELETAYVAPRTPLEETLTHIWAEVIGVERVGVYDNFFELGGHSLLATQLISRLRNEFQVELPLRRLFEQPTVADLAQIISQQLAEQEDAKEMEQLLAELELLSDEEARQMLAPREEATPRQ